VQLSVVRDKEERKIPIVLETAPQLPREMKKYEDPNFEFRVRDMAMADRQQRSLPESQRGVLVEAVSEGGWAALGHLADGDLILAIDGEVVKDVAAVQRKMTQIAEKKPPTVVLQVRRGIRTFFVEMQGGWK
jgi:S1-C subfamily serine protease